MRSASARPAKHRRGPHRSLQIPQGAQIRFNADFWRSAFDCDALRDDQRERLEPFVPGGCKGKGGPRTDNRRFLNSLLWMARPGGRWRDLPELIGRLRKREAALLPLDRDGCSGCHPRALAREADLEWLIIDSTIVRAHQHAAGARREKGGGWTRAVVNIMDELKFCCADA